MGYRLFKHLVTVVQTKATRRHQADVVDRMINLSKERGRKRQRWTNTSAGWRADGDDAQTYDSLVKVAAVVPGVQYIKSGLERHQVFHTRRGAQTHIK